MVCPLPSHEFLDKLTTEGESIGLVKFLKKKFTSAEDTLNIFFKKSGSKYKLEQWVKQFTERSKYAKSKEISETYRSKGNSLFVGPMPESSLKYYTLAVKYAPTSSNELRLAFGNRSAILFLMEKYEEALEDINYALNEEENYERQIKLLLRKAKCLLNSGRLDETLEVLDKSKFLLDTHKDNKTTKLKRMKKDLEINLQKLADVKASGQSDVSHFEDIGAPKLPQLSYGTNPDFPHASNSLTLRHDSVKGRYVVANRPIDIGESLFVEKPFAFVVLKDCSSSHCHYCCTNVINPLPCDKCSEAIFCNESCRREAWVKFHKWECGAGLDLCYSLGIAHLSLRLAIVGVNSSEEYLPVKNLISHLEDLQETDLYQYTLTSAILCTYLRTCTSFFNMYKRIDVLNFGGMILKHIAQLVCNGHAITGILDEKNEGINVYSEEQVRIATAIFPSASMMNHSCDSNIMNSFSGQYLIIKASRSIDEGEEVFNCYGPHFRRMSLVDRQKYLKEQYKFTCKCDPCTNSSKKEFYQRFVGILCFNCQGPVFFNASDHEYKCIDCRTKNNNINETGDTLLKADSALRAGEEAMECKNYKIALSNYENSLKLRESVLYKHNFKIRECKDKMAKCHAFLGDYNQSFNLIEGCIFGNNEQYGECSPEFVHEILKLSDVFSKMIETQTIDRDTLYKMVGYLDRATIVIDILFGKWHKSYQEVIEKKLHLQNVLIR